MCDPDRLYDACEVGKLLGLKKETVYYIPEHKLPKYKIGPRGGTTRYLGRDIMAYLETCRVA